MQEKLSSYKKGLRKKTSWDIYIKPLEIEIPWWFAQIDSFEYQL